MNSNTTTSRSLRDYFAAWISTPLGRNTLSGLAGYGLRLALQAAYFIIIARCLGAREYGAFIAVTALGAVVSPFVGLGSGNLLVKNVARDRNEFREYWGNGLLMTFVSGVVLAALAVSLCGLLIPQAVALKAAVLVSVSDLIFVRLLDMAGWAFLATERLAKSAVLNVLISLTRLVGIAALALHTTHAGLLAWSAVYLAGSVFAATVAVGWVTFSLGTPALALHRIRSEAREGLHFCFGASALTIYNDIDKTMMARLSTLEGAGIYAAAYRLIDVAFIPVRALLNAAYPGFFRSGTNGMKAAMNYGQRLLRKIFPYSLLAFAGLMIGAPIVPRLLGHDYAHVTEALRWLALLPILKTLHYFIADALTGSGRQGLRTCIQSVVAVFNISINLWIIPRYGWRGAAWSSLASDALLLVGLWSAATLVIRAEACPTTTTAEPALTGRS